MTDELIDICDENNNLIGVRKMKSDAYLEGLWHRAVHVWIYNSHGEILLQLRAKNKELYPNMWDISVAGHIIAGEDPVVSALRESREEIGLSFKKEDLDLFKIRKSKIDFRKIKDNEFIYIYFLKFDGNAAGLSIQNGEVESVQFFPTDEIKKGLENNPEKYVPQKDYWFDVMDEIRQRLKCLKK